MKLILKPLTTFTLIFGVIAFVQSAGTVKTSWRYYRPGNTGIQGDYNESIWIGPDNDPWIGGYNPIAEEGGVAKFIQSENRWFNVSNVDYSVIGNANDAGVSRISDMTNDNQGNLWMRRSIGNQNKERLDYILPNGTWVSPPLPPSNGNVSVSALLPYGSLQALMVDGFMQLQQFNGSTWTNLGPVPHSSWIDDLDRDADGNVWLCGTGTGGAIKRNAVTGIWQRYRVTNTSQFDFFNLDLSLDPQSNNFYATANASSGVGGMVKFDGERWKGFVNDLGYGLTGPWPFPGSPQSEAVYVRPSNGNVIVNPINSYSHEFDGAMWTAFSGGPDQVANYVEDSLGRLWCAGHYGGIGYFQNGVYSFVEASGWSSKVFRDPQRPGTV